MRIPESINVGSRFFFFNTLKFSKDPLTKNILEQAEGILKQNPLTNDTNEEGKNKIEEALNFLLEMYLKEASIEKEYF